MQKTYTVSHLSHKKIRNDGKSVPTYYIRDHHKAIIAREEFETVQKILAMRDAHVGCYQYPFYGLLKCPHCGANMIAVPLRTKGMERAWACGGSGKGKLRHERTDCPPACVKEKYVIRAVAEVLGTKGDFNFPMMQRDIEFITFDALDWHEMIVQRKNGEQSQIHIEYERKSEVPANEVVINGSEVFLDGVLMGSSHQDMIAAKSILSVREYLQNVSITETENIPIVKAPRK